MIAVLDSNGEDATPRKDGLLGGLPWTALAHSDPVAWTSLGPVMVPPRAAETMRISYEVRGRRTGSSAILSVGQANVSNSGGTAVLTEIVETFTHARVQLSVVTNDVRIQVQSHLTEDWEFQVRVAYDLTVPVA